MISGDIPQVPQPQPDLERWAREMVIYLEKVLRDHNMDIQNLYDTKADA
jgi:hypothetical protein